MVVYKTTKKKDLINVYIHMGNRLDTKLAVDA